ncbi:xanthine dehydrogenase molybdopterin binding subunit [Spirochaetota bacterium]
MSKDKRNPDSILNVLGKTVYIDDVPESSDMLHAGIVVSPSAHGRFTGLDFSKAMERYPDIQFFTAKDIPGQNELSTSEPDEPLFADGTWHYQGEILALILGPSRSVARKAAALVSIIGREDMPAILDPRAAYEKGMFIPSPRTIVSGDTEAAFKNCDLVISGQADSLGQEHVYLETQGAVAMPGDDGGVRLLSGTQSPSGVQAIVARILGVPMHRVEVEARRLGGAFGGKEDQASGWAAMAALGAIKTGRPVKLYLNRHDDMIATGKRHPYSSDYKIGLKKDGTILAFEAVYYQNSGASADLSPAVIPRTLFHAAGTYEIPNIKVSGYMCRTNFVPFTAFRGFGGPQGFFVIESALDKAAMALGMDRAELQKKNLIKEGHKTHYGMSFKDVRAELCFDACIKQSDYKKLRAEINAFNLSHKALKKGAAIVPVCFGISFTKIMLNQGGALVHVYNDGSVSVATGAIEMGQGVGRKIAKISARALGSSLDAIRIDCTRTSTVANTVATAASTGTDINGMAAQMACLEINKRLKSLAAEKLATVPEKIIMENGSVFVLEGAAKKETGLSFAKLVGMSYESRTDLSAHAFYATPGLYYDIKTERGNPFLYHVYGAALVTATVDSIRGTYRFDQAFMVHDLAESIDETIDLGQVEGAFAQGLGWACLEELKFDQSGRLLANTLSTYKVPDANFMPNMHIEFLRSPNPLAVANSKAVGEPPLIYGIAGYFAVMDALKAARPGEEGFYDLPMTPEKALLFLSDELPGDVAR